MMLEAGREQKEDEETLKSAMSFGLDEMWVRLKHSDFLEIEEQLDTIIELTCFCLWEPIKLGFFFRTAGLTACDTSRSALM